MNEQEIFDTVVNHLRKQNKKSDDNAGSLYRSSKGLKCAVGCLIYDEEYKPEMEGYAVGILANNHIPRFRPYISLLRRLQKIHDGMRVEEWECGLKDVGTAFELDLTSCEWGLRNE